jgi:phage anti-repressor protein
MQNSSKAINYRLFKDNFELENYFNNLEDKDIYTLCKFRTTNLKLPIETGRWYGIDRENRQCSKCNSRSIAVSINSAKDLVCAQRSTKDHKAHFNWHKGPTY